MDDAEVPNVYTKKNGISGEITNAFDTRADAEISICFRNTLPEGRYIYIIFFLLLRCLLNLYHKMDIRFPWITRLFTTC